MKTKKPIFRLVAFAALSFFTGNEVVAQTSLGAACGCPAVGDRTTTQAINTLGTWTNLPAAAYGKELGGNQNIVLTCNKIWTITEKLYIGPGSTLTIEPGTLIKGQVAGSVAAATAIIIERGGKIIAPGVEDCPIVFTAADDVNLNGDYGVVNKGKWGGILICGKATNNLTLAANGPFTPGISGKMAVANGLGVLEGFASSIPQDQFGVAIGSGATPPTGYASATTGVTTSGTYSYTATPVTQNQNGALSLVVTSTSTALNTAINGKVITGTGIPASTIITTTTSSTALGLSNSATAELTGSYVVADITTQAGDVTSASPTLALSATNASVLVGMTVSGTGIPAGTTVTAVSNQTVTLSANATSSATASTYTFGYTFTASDVTNKIGSAKMRFPATGYIVPGLSVSGTGIPANATVTAVSSTTGVVTLSANLTAALSTSTASVTFAGSFSTLTSGSQAYYPVAPSYATAGGTIGLANDGTTLVNFAGQPVAITGGTAAFEDDDNSGILTYVSIRHSGANLLVGSEINGLTLASVGRGTKVEHVEIVSCADDNIEIFGGTVNIKYCTTLFGNDDMYDFDLGWTGKAQFLFGMKANQFTTANGTLGSTASGISPDNDHGFEIDSDDSQSYNLPRTTPVIYNATIIGNDKIALTSGGDNTSLSAVLFKENGAGSLNNSIFANFKNGFNMKRGLGTSSAYAKGGEAWHNWTNLVTATTTGTGSTASNSLNVTSPTSIVAGMFVNGTGLPYGTKVSSVSGNVVTLSANSTLAMSGTYTFSTPTDNTAGNGSQILKVKCNTFVMNAIPGSSSVVASTGSTSASPAVLPGAAATAGTEMHQFITLDKNIEATSLTGFSTVFLINGSTNAVTAANRNDVVPASQANVELGTGCAQAPMDGFFEPANYRGAFKPGVSNDNWLSDWSYSEVINASKGVKACPTDINNDGVTNVSDFLDLSGEFGNSCN